VVTHGILSGDAIEQINKSELSQLIMTNTVRCADKQKKCHKLVVIDLAPILAEAIRRIHNGESLSTLFREFEDEITLFENPMD
jgi:ribose-phosphate pyrophosphokinase